MNNVLIAVAYICLQNTYENLIVFRLYILSDDCSPAKFMQFFNR